MPTISLLIVVGYLLLVGIFAVICLRSDDLDAYFINSRETPWYILLFTVVSTNVGAGTATGVAAAAYNTGIGFAVFGAANVFFGYILVAIFGPTIREFGNQYSAHTLAEFFGVYYSPSAQVVTSLVISITYLFFLSSQILGITAIIEVGWGWKFIVALTVAVVGLMVYTYISGARSDYYTDAAHFVVMSFALVAASVAGFGSLANPSNLLAQLPDQYLEVTNFAGAEFFILGIVFGSAALLVSMDFWQRIYSAGSETAARWVFMGGLLVNIPFFAISTHIGLSLKAKDVAISNPDLALITGFVEYLDPVFLGIATAGLLAAFLSTANTMIMVVTSSITKDVIFGGYMMDTDEISYQDLLPTARKATIVVLLTAVGLSYAIPSIVQQSLNAFFMLTILIPPFFGALIFGKEEAKESAGTMSLLVGVVITLIAMPFAPKMAFIPGFFITLLTYVGIQYTAS